MPQETPVFAELPESTFTPSPEVIQEAQEAGLDVEAPAVETPAVETPAVETPAVETPPPSEEGIDIDFDAVSVKPKTPTDNRVPFARFNEVNQRAKRLAEQNAALQEQLNPASLQELDTKLDAAQDQYEKAIMEGDSENIQRFRKEIRAISNDIHRVQAQQITQQVSIKAQQEDVLAQTVQHIVADFPVFDSNSSYFDEGLVKEANALQAGLISTGKDPASALQQAVEYIALRYDLRAVSTQKPPSAPKATPVKSAEEAARDKKAATIKRNLDAANRQPPNAASIGENNASAHNSLPKHLTSESLDKFTPEQLAQMRGDFV